MIIVDYSWLIVYDHVKQLARLDSQILRVNTYLIVNPALVSHIW